MRGRPANMIVLWIPLWKIHLQLRDRVSSLNSVTCIETFLIELLNLITLYSVDWPLCMTYSVLINRINFITITGKRKQNVKYFYSGLIMIYNLIISIKFYTQKVAIWTSQFVVFTSPTETLWMKTISSVYREDWKNEILIFVLVV